MGLYKLTEILNLTETDSQLSGEKTNWGDLQGKAGFLEDSDRPGDIRDLDKWTREARMTNNNNQSASLT